MTKQLYAYLADTLREKIILGKLGVGDKLPSMDEIAEMFNVSKTTVTRSLTILTNEGYLYAIPKVGYFVAGEKGKSFAINYRDLLTSRKAIDNRLPVSKSFSMIGDRGFLNISEVLCTGEKRVAYNSVRIESPETDKLIGALSEDISKIKLTDYISNVFKMNRELSIRAMRCPADVLDKLGLEPDSTVMRVKCIFSEDSGVIVTNITYFRNDSVALKAYAI